MVAGGEAPEPASSTYPPWSPAVAGHASITTIPLKKCLQM